MTDSLTTLFAKPCMYGVVEGLAARSDVKLSRECVGYGRWAKMHQAAKKAQIVLNSRKRPVVHFHSPTPPLPPMASPCYNLLAARRLIIRNYPSF